MNLEKKQDWSSEGAIARGKARLARLDELSKFASASVVTTKPIPSMAPAPIEAVRSSGYVKPKPASIPIDWSHWNNMPQVALWEAVALSINANPDDLKFRETRETNERFTKRLSIALSHVDAGKLALVEHYPANRPVSRIDLPKFAAWANAQNFGDVPLDLYLIAANAEPEAGPVPLSASVAENEIRLLPGTTHVEFGELAILLTEAQWPNTKPDPTGMGKTFLRIEHEKELMAAATDRSLPLKKTSTFGPLNLFANSSIQSACVAVPDFQAYAKSRFVDVVTEPGTQAAPDATEGVSNQPLIKGAEAIDFAMLASRQQLIAAFGAFTGMDDKWFTNLKDIPKLKDARKVAGQGGRGHITEPLFCPYLVMRWLIDPKRKKGRKLSSDKAWQLLEDHFSKVYNQYSVGDTRPN